MFKRCFSFHAKRDSDCKVLRLRLVRLNNEIAL
jgi:hypothetical protein